MQLKPGQPFAGIEGGIAPPADAELVRYADIAAAFRQACNARPLQEQLPQLPAPTADQRARLQGLRTELAGALAPKPPRQWARTVLERHESGKHVATPAALDMARSTLRARFDEPAVSDYRNPRDAS